MGFHEDRMQASEEASLQVTHAGLPGGEQGTIVVVIVVALPETLTLQHSTQWYAPADFGGAVHPAHV